jgi:hypothetical protein
MICGLDTLLSGSDPWPRGLTLSKSLIEGNSCAISFPSALFFPLVQAWLDSSRHGEYQLAIDDAKAANLSRRDKLFLKPIGSRCRQSPTRKRHSSGRGLAPSPSQDRI